MELWETCSQFLKKTNNFFFNIISRICSSSYRHRRHHHQNNKKESILRAQCWHQHSCIVHWLTHVSSLLCECVRKNQLNFLYKIPLEGSRCHFKRSVKEIDFSRIFLLCQDERNCVFRRFILDEFNKLFCVKKCRVTGILVALHFRKK